MTLELMNVVSIRSFVMSWSSHDPRCDMNVYEVTLRAKLFLDINKNLEWHKKTALYSLGYFSRFNSISSSIYWFWLSSPPTLIKLESLYICAYYVDKQILSSLFLRSRRSHVGSHILWGPKTHFVLRRNKACPGCVLSSWMPNIVRFKFLF